MKDKLMKNAKDTMKLGITSMAGLGAMGAMTKIPGMPAQASGVVSMAGTGMTLLNTGQMLKNASSITEGFDSKVSTKKKK